MKKLADISFFESLPNRNGSAFNSISFGEETNITNSLFNVSQDTIVVPQKSKKKLIGK